MREFTPAEEIRLEYLTPSLLAGSANSFCEDCRDLRKLGLEVIDELPPTEDVNPIIVVGRFAGYAALCPRDEAIPKAECKPGLCGQMDENRKCQLRELIGMTPEQRAQKVRELAHGKGHVEFTAD